MIVFDLDGTLALDHHRSHFLKGDVKYWDEYFNACEHDEPNLPVIAILKSLSWTHENKIEIWTGRSDIVEKQTIVWLDQQGITGHISALRMRQAGDRTQDDVLKLSWAREAAERGDPVTLVFEDRQRVVDAWRAEGITCLQVAPGAF